MAKKTTGTKTRTAKLTETLERYPEAMADLLSLGEPAPDASYVEWANRLKANASDLVRMVMDDDLNQRQPGDPAVWAPIHALRILAILGPSEAAEPLLACMDWDDEWLVEELPPVYGAIGPAAIPILHTYLQNASHDLWGRMRASHSLASIAQAHPSAYDEIVSMLTAFLDRPDADTGGDEESLTADVICDLADLKATGAYEAICRVYAEDRVDTQIVSLEDVERDFAMLPPVDPGRPPGHTEEPGVRLELKCKACGRERSHVFPMVYCDLGTLGDAKKSARYNPIIIPQRVVCPKCGAVNQYELGGMGYVALLANVMAIAHPEIPDLLPENKQIRFITFTTRWGPMHPQEAIERYQRELAQWPDDVSLHIGFGNALRLLGHFDEAHSEYERATELDPGEPEVWINLAQLAGLEQDIPSAIRCWEKVQELSSGTALPLEQRRLLAGVARESLIELRHGEIPKYDPTTPLPSPTQAASSTAEAMLPSPRSVSHARVGRNDPCPCGSGKKYKHCHLAADQERARQGQI